MRIHTDHQHRSVHTATVDEDVALRIIAERVAEKVGVSLDADGVAYRAYISSRDTSIGIRHDVKVEITHDHAAKPKAD